MGDTPTIVSNKPLFKIRVFWDFAGYHCTPLFTTHLSATVSREITGVGGEGRFYYSGTLLTVLPAEVFMSRLYVFCRVAIFMLAGSSAGYAQFDNVSTAVPGAAKLVQKGDLAADMVQRADDFLLRETESLAVARPQRLRAELVAAGKKWKAPLDARRKQLRYALGLVDDRPAFDSPQLVATVNQPTLLAGGNGVNVMAVRWPATAGLTGEGLLLQPANGSYLASVVVIPDADQTPEMLAGLEPGVPDGQQLARILAQSGCRVLSPALINRKLSARKRRAVMTNREFLHRPAYVLGRHIAGYELQKVLAAIDWFAKSGNPKTGNPKTGNQAGHSTGNSIGVAGYGEGGMLAMYAAALDARIGATLVSGFAGSCDTIWRQPVTRNVFGLLEIAGDAELAALAAPGQLIIEHSAAPKVTLASTGGAPGSLVTPSKEKVTQAIAQARTIMEGYADKPWIQFIVAEPPDEQPFFTANAARQLLHALRPGSTLPESPAPFKLHRKLPDSGVRHQRQMDEIVRRNEELLTASPYVRRAFMKNLDTSSIAKYTASVQPYREHFYSEVIGRFPHKLASPAPHARKTYSEKKWTGYEVSLDVFGNIPAYGILLVPRGIKPGEKRPVVVCQHGLEGRPQDVVAGGHRAYHDFAARLAQRGFVVFAPQNLYIGKDKFRTLQRKANPLKKTLFSIIVPQHQQIVNWLAGLPYVDPQRIGFYGLSYGGKSAMRIPPLVPQYALSICSADFNEWVWKNASTRARHSYVWTGEYEIFEFNLGSTFNYAEMAALIAPRPFMVERGHFDGVAPDETVGYEFAKVRHLYAARLKLKDTAEIEWFDGPHTINGKGTFDFLHKHLKHPQ